MPISVLDIERLSEETNTVLHWIGVKPSVQSVTKSFPCPPGLQFLENTNNGSVFNLGELVRLVKKSTLISENGLEQGMEHTMYVTAIGTPEEKIVIKELRSGVERMKGIGQIRDQTIFGITLPRLELVLRKGGSNCTSRENSG
ncbi:hypothetical protein J6590_068645 [Homalodisca vitripennis]|nr:hypothetical protein J6590_068645 [Homalodisca vitripennis]